ncbi:MAG: hypothetical protein ACFFCS_19265 [Candidatus Hodarchaeota archaeon]
MPLKGRNFVIRIGKFDEREGPICLNAQKDQMCDFIGEKCNGVTSRVIVDALGVNKEKFTFEEETELYQVINVKIPNPFARGRMETYSIIIKLESGIGKLRGDIISEIKADFLEIFGNLQESPNLESAIAFTDKWMQKLSRMENITDIAKKEAEIRKSTATQFLISFIGGLLAKKINKPVEPSRGLIQLAFNDAKESKMEHITFPVVKKIFENELKNRLISIKIPNVQVVVKDMVSELAEHQSLLMMMNI